MKNYSENYSRLFTALHHCNIRALDYEAVKKFYTEGLGLVCPYEWEEPGIMCCLIEIAEGQFIEIFSNLTGEPLPDGVVNHFALKTTDIEEAVKKAVAAGATLEGGPKTNETVMPKSTVQLKIAFLKTPNGEIIELVESGQAFF